MRLEHGIEPAGINGGNGNARPGAALLERLAEIDRDPDDGPSWFARRPWGIFLAAIYPILALTPLAILAALKPESDHPRLAEVGVDCAVVGFTMIALQFVITARLHWIEAPFGLDLLLVFHRATALIAVTLLCLHPLLVASAEGWSLITRVHVHWCIWAGRAALAILLVQVIISLWRRALRLPYTQWRRLHNVFALALLGLGFAHALAVGLEPIGATIVWSVVIAVAAGCWLFSRAIRPRLLLRRGFRVVVLKEEAPRVWTVVLESQPGRPLRFVPGQFQFLRLHGAELPAEEHPFTIASSPTRSGRISLTIKESGTFTALIDRIRPGDRATVHGPFGRFSHTLHPDDEDLVFVAGGVGITPLMSMLRYMRDHQEPRSVLLIYASRRPLDVVFASELREIAAGAFPLLTVVHVFSDAPPGWPGETGRLDADRLARLCDGVDGKAFYLCCPGPMTTALVRGLRRMGVSPRRIHTDHFAL
jgi:predicted ferric reductase